MKKFLAVLLCVILLGTNAYAFAPITEEEQINDENVTFIVEIEGDPVLNEGNLKKGRSNKTLQEEILDEQAEVISTIKEEVSENAEKGYTYTSLFNGFSLDGKKSQLDDLKQVDGVKNVYISRVIPEPKPRIYNAEEITYVGEAYKSEYTGKGQAIAIIDSFCDTSHEFFKTVPENPKYTKSDIESLIDTQNLNAADISANDVYKNEKIPFAYNYATKTSDTYSNENTHGTHVTGIAAGKNGKLPDGTSFSGVAYDAQVLFMNASNGKGLSDSVIFAAIDDAVKLGADVINMSFGLAYGDTAIETVYQTHMDNAKKCGILISAAAGNSAMGCDEITPLTVNPDYSTGGTPAGFESATAVASADNSKQEMFYWKMNYADNRDIAFYICYDGSEFDKKCTEYIEYVDCGYGLASDFANKSLSDKIALIKRGDITFGEKVQNAKAAGAVGVIFINSEDAVFTTIALQLPAAVVTKTDGEKLIAATEKKVKHISTDRINYNIPTAGKISYYSSYGVDSTLQLKPEITAPGGSVYSSYPDNEYAYASGTSMAAPHMTGVYAIEREFYKTNPYISKFNGFTDEKLVTLLENNAMSSADIIYNDNGVPYSPRVQGAGMVNVKKIINNKVILSGDGGKSKISLGEIKNNSFEVSFKITNMSKESITFDKISLELITDGYFTDLDENLVGDSVKINDKATISMPNAVTVESGEEKDFTATVTLDNDFVNENKKIFTNGFFIDGFVILDTADNSNNVSIPFTGFYGDWYALPVFDTTAYDEGGSALADMLLPYTTGTFLKAYINQRSYYHVGRNPADNTIVDKKYIAYSSTGGLTLAMALKNYRAVSKVDFTIEDKNGHTVYSDTDSYPTMKFYNYDYRFDKNQTSKLSEGNYTIKAKATPLGATSVKDELTLPLVIDNTKPELLSATYDTDKKELTLSIKDNHYPAYIYVDYDDNGYMLIPITESDIKNGVAVKTISLQAVKNTETVELDIIDYAQNSSYYTLNALTDKVGVVPEAIYKFGGTATTQINIRNNTGKEFTADVYVTFYDENSRMVGTDKKTAVKINKTDTLLEFICDTKKAVTMKVFIWEENTLTPVDTAKEFKLAG